MNGDGRPPIRVPKLWELPPSEQLNPTVLVLLEICRRQQEENQLLKDEIARLKGNKPRPTIRPSVLEGGPKREPEGPSAGRGKNKRRKTRLLPVHESVVIRPEHVPQGSRFKGYREFTIQDLRIEAHNTRYCLERWKTPSGEEVVGRLPAACLGGHFGPTLVSFILYQYYHAQVTQPLMLEQLREWGVEISAGQVNAIITEGKERFHEEKEQLLRTGLELSSYIQVDDTTARHQGHNGYCTYIGNELFAYFASTDSKSRINFLELLQGGVPQYLLDAEALAYMVHHKLPRQPLAALSGQLGREVHGKEAWRSMLAGLEIQDPRHVRIATEGALLGGVLAREWSLDLTVLSDDAGQFDVLRHALCWIHAERGIHKLLGVSPAQTQAQEQVRAALWDLYQDLKAYKDDPRPDRKGELEVRFDQLCTTPSCFVSLDLALRRMHERKAELLAVLDRPELPLHNNLSESDIREYVKRRKVSGSTRGDEGRRCRDTFTSLKKTCRKLGVSFWSYLEDRVRGCAQIATLPVLMRRQAGAVVPQA
jgi:hypothetical protein